MKKQTGYKSIYDTRNKTIETFILTLSENQKLYNLRNNKTKHNRKSKIYNRLSNRILQTDNKQTQTQTQHKAQTKPQTQTQGTKRIKPPLFYDSRSTGDNSL